MKKKLAILIIWIGVWFLLDAVIRNDILFAGPVKTLSALAGLAGTADFWLSIATTLLKVVLGFLTGAVCGVVFAALSIRFPLFGDFLSPFVTVLKSVPVVSFVILILIWAGNRTLSYVVCVVVVFPVIYFNALGGFKSADKKLLEAAAVFRMPLRSRIRGIWYPAVMPYIISSFRSALGMSWKSSVAAEVIGQPLHTIGNELYKSKIWLDTPALFAWTLVIVLLSLFFEKAVLKLIQRKQQPGSAHSGSNQ